MYYQDPCDPEPTPRLMREQRLRLFEQLHQSPDIDTLNLYDIYCRASGYTRCKHCGLPYRDHPLSEELVDYEGRPFERRLCDGTVVHL